MTCVKLCWALTLEFRTVRDASLGNEKAYTISVHSSALKTSVILNRAQFALEIYLSILGFLWGGVVYDLFPCLFYILLPFEHFYV